MNEIEGLTKKLVAELRMAAPELLVERGFPVSKRPLPPRRKMAIVSVGKVTLAGLDFGGFAGGTGGASAKRMDIEFCVTLSSPDSGEECWQLFEKVAGRLAFSDELPVVGMDCGTAAFNRDWGGILLPMKVSCSLTVTSGKEPIPLSFTQMKLIPTVK